MCIIQAKEWGRFARAEMTMLDALQLLNNLVDQSDPDVNEFIIKYLTTI